MKSGFLKMEILLQLQTGEKNGYELINKIGQEIGSKPSAGSMQPAFKDLIEKKVITCREDDGKKIYALTPKGEKELKEILYDKQTTILKNVDILRRFGEISGKDAVNSAITHFENFDSNPIFMVRVIDILLPLEKQLLKLLKDRESEEKTYLLNEMIKTLIENIKKM